MPNIGRVWGVNMGVVKAIGQVQYPTVHMNIYIYERTYVK